MPYLSALEVCSRRGAIQIHVYIYLTVKSEQKFSRTVVPKSENSMQQKGQRAKVPGKELARKRKGQGAKGPRSELALLVLLADSLQAANRPGSEKARYLNTHTLPHVSLLQALNQ